MDVLDIHIPKILDLARNFQINLEEVLTKYIWMLKDEAPERIGDFSFPQAALLLEHCAEIYGRKVDYVHGLAVELAEHVNVRLYGNESEKNTPEAQDVGNLAKKPSIRRKKNISEVTLEDFRLQEIPLDNPRTVRKTKKPRKNHCREPGYGQFSVINKTSNHEHEVYDDELCAIGTKDQFRLNWHLEQTCRLSEHIMDGVSGCSWSVHDVGVANMLTPEHSNDGIADSIGADNPHDYDAEVAEPVADVEVAETVANLTADAVVAETVSHLAADAEVVEAVSHMSAQESGGDLKPELPDLFKPVSNEGLVVKPPLVNSPFKLPAELIKKKDEPECNITMFLFSNLLKRTLKMKGLLPPPSRDSHGEKKLIAKHVQFLYKRYNLGNRKTPNLREGQADFLGFEEEILPDVPEVLSDAYDNNQIASEIGVEPPKASGEARESSDPDTNPDVDGDWQEETYTADVMATMMDYNSRKKTTVDVEGIADWRNYIRSKLTSTETERNFDVHEYSTDIIHSFRNVGENISFGDMAGGLSSKEISRYLVSTLMLANTSNLELENYGPNTLRMTLISTERHHEMEDILVPPAAGGIVRKSPSSPQPRKASKFKKPSLTVRAPVFPPLHISEEDVIEAGPSGTQASSRLPTLDSSAESLSSSVRKRNHSEEIVDDDGDHCDIFNININERIRKQVPGAGPWVNKSKKARCEETKS